jgi:hypothetical protein
MSVHGFFVVLLSKIESMVIILTSLLKRFAHGCVRQFDCLVKADDLEELFRGGF